MLAMVGAWGLTVRDTHRVALAALLAAVASRPSSHPVALTPWLSPFFVGLPRWVFGGLLLLSFGFFAVVFSFRAFRQLWQVRTSVDSVLCRGASADPGPGGAR